RVPPFHVAHAPPPLRAPLLPPPPLDARRSATVARYVGAFPRTLEEAKANLDEAAAPFARLAIADLDGIGPRLRDAIAAVKPLLVASEVRTLDAGTARAVMALDGYKSWLEARVATMPAGSAVGRESYVFFLKN